MFGHYVFAYLRQIDTVSGGEGFVILERRCDVLVAGQRVEVVPVAVVNRGGLLPHPAIDVIRIREEVLGERVEFDRG